MLCHFQIISVASWTFALIFCAWFSVCRWIEKSKIAFSAVAVESINWSYYFAHRYRFSVASLSADHWHPTAPRHFNAQQSRCCSSCLWLPLSSRADLIQINLLILACTCAARATSFPQRQRGERAGTARRRASEPLREATAARCKYVCACI